MPDSAQACLRPHLGPIDSTIRGMSVRACDSGSVRRRIPRDLEERYLRVVNLRVPMPHDDASDDDWNAWADLQHVQALLTGWAGRIGRREVAVSDQDEAHLRELRDLTSSPGVVDLVGDDVAADARAAADRLFDLLATG